MRLTALPIRVVVAVRCLFSGEVEAEFRDTARGTQHLLIIGYFRNTKVIDAYIMVQTPSESSLRMKLISDSPIFHSINFRKLSCDYSDAIILIRTTTQRFNVCVIIPSFMCVCFITISLGPWVRVSCTTCGECPAQFGVSYGGNRKC